jgi:hypothetical protein
LAIAVHRHVTSPSNKYPCLAVSPIDPVINASLHNVYNRTFIQRGIDQGAMYLRMFRKAGQTRRFTITDAGNLGWEVREEQDSQIVWSIRYTDWHRVERARMTFAREAAALASAGWQES